VRAEISMNAESTIKTMRRRPAPFSEVGAWREVGGGWQPLFGNFRGAGFSVEWHDFFARRE
jgi:hypothetical protein